MLWTVSRKRKRTGLQSEDLIEFVSMAPMCFWITFLKSPGVGFFKWYVCKIKQVLLWNWTKSDCVSESNCMSSCNFLLSIYSYSCSTGEREKYYYLFSCSVMSKTFVTPWTVALQDALSMGFLRQEHWSGLHFLLQGIFLTEGSNLGLLHWQAGSLLTEPPRRDLSLCYPLHRTLLPLENSYQYESSDNSSSRMLHLSVNV